MFSHFWQDSNRRRGNRPPLRLELLEERTVLTAGSVEAVWMVAYPIPPEGELISMVEAAPPDAFPFKDHDERVAAIKALTEAWHQAADEDVRLALFIDFFGNFDFEGRDNFAPKPPEANIDDYMDTYLDEAVENGSQNLNSALETNSAPVPTLSWEDIFSSFSSSQQKLKLVFSSSVSLDVEITLATVPSERTIDSAPSSSITPDVGFVDIVPPDVVQVPQEEVDDTVMEPDEIDETVALAVAVSHGANFDWQGFVMGHGDVFDRTSPQPQIELLAALLVEPEVFSNSTHADVVVTDVRFEPDRGASLTETILPLDVDTFMQDLELPSTVVEHAVTHIDDYIESEAAFFEQQDIQTQKCLQAKIEPSPVSRLLASAALAIIALGSVCNIPRIRMMLRSMQDNSSDAY